MRSWCSITQIWECNVACTPLSWLSILVFFSSSTRGQGSSWFGIIKRIAPMSPVRTAEYFKLTSTNQNIDDGKWNEWEKYDWSDSIVVWRFGDKTGNAACWILMMRLGFLGRTFWVIIGNMTDREIESDTMFRYNVDLCSIEFDKMFEMTCFENSLTPAPTATPKPWTATQKVHSCFILLFRRGS